MSKSVQSGTGASPASSTPGLTAGDGTAGYGNGTTPRLKTSRDETVAAEPGKDGPSEMRPRESPNRAEDSARSARDIAIDFLKVQEEALASEPLPFSRREHVLRYFTALRRQLESKAPR